MMYSTAHLDFRISYSRPIAANCRLWPDIAPKIRYQARGFRRHMQVRVKSVISFHSRSMCAFSAVGWVFMWLTVAHLSAGNRGGESVYLLGANIQKESA